VASRRARDLAHRIALGVVALWVLAGGAGPAHGACPPGRATGSWGDRLVVGFAAAPPFVISGGAGAVGGLAIDALRAMAKAEDWRLELVELAPDTLRARLAACELDLGVLGGPARAELTEAFELSLPYLITETTAIVKADDAARAAPRAGNTRGGRFGYLALRGLGYGLAALGALALASWLLNTFTGFPGGPPLRWRRLDATVGGPWAAVRWLARSGTGRLLVALWAAVGIALGVSGALGSGPPPVLGDDPLRALVEAAAHGEALVGERYPDGAQVHCAPADVGDCFRAFADGTLAAIAGPREVLCMHKRALSLDGAILRGDLAISEQFAYVLPPGSPLHARLGAALLRLHDRVRPMSPADCPGDRR
jgi:ABC-type amino acid transport substrate-binding protein